MPADRQLTQFLIHRFFSGESSFDQLTRLSEKTSTFLAALISSNVILISRIIDPRQLRAFGAGKEEAEAFSAFTRHLRDIERVGKLCPYDELTEADLQTLFEKATRELAFDENDSPPCAVHTALCLLDRSLDRVIGFEKTLNERLPERLANTGTTESEIAKFARARSVLAGLLAFLAWKGGAKRLPVQKSPAVLTPIMLPTSAVQLRDMTAALRKAGRRTRLLLAFLHNGLLAILLRNGMTAEKVKAALCKGGKGNAEETEALSSQIDVSVLGKAVFAKEAKAFNQDDLADLYFMKEVQANLHGAALKPFGDALQLLLRTADQMSGSREKLRNKLMRERNLNEEAEFLNELLSAAELTLPMLADVPTIGFPADAAPDPDLDARRAWQAMAPHLSPEDRLRLAVYLKRGCEIVETVTKDADFFRAKLSEAQAQRSDIRDVYPGYIAAASALKPVLESAIAAEKTVSVPVLPDDQRPHCMGITMYRGFTANVAEAYGKLTEESDAHAFLNLLAFIVGLGESYCGAKVTPGKYLSYEFYESLATGADSTVIEALACVGLRLGAVLPVDEDLPSPEDETQKTEVAKPAPKKRRTRKPTAEKQEVLDRQGTLF